MAAAEQLADPSLVFDRAITATAELLNLSPAAVLETIQTYARQTSFFRRQDEREERRRAAKAKVAEEEAAKNEGAPTAERNGQGDLEDRDGYIGAAKVKARVSVPPIERMMRHGEITKRQYQAAAKFQADYVVGIVGIRDRDPFAEKSRSFAPKALALSEVQITAGKAYAVGAQALGKLYGPVIRAIVLEEESVDAMARRLTKERQGGVKAQKDAAVDEWRENALPYDKPEWKGSYTQRERGRLLWTLRRGLDILGDVQRLPRELTAESISRPGGGEIRLITELVYRHEASGRLSGVTLGGAPWIVEAESIADLREMAIALLTKRDAMKVSPKMEDVHAGAATA